MIIINWILSNSKFVVKVDDIWSLYSDGCSSVSQEVGSKFLLFFIYPRFSRHVHLSNLTLLVLFWLGWRNTCIHHIVRHINIGIESNDQPQLSRKGPKADKTTRDGLSLTKRTYLIVTIISVFSFAFIRTHRKYCMFACSRNLKPDILCYERFQQLVTGMLIGQCGTTATSPHYFLESCGFHCIPNPKNID